MVGQGSREGIREESDIQGAHYEGEQGRCERRGGHLKAPHRALLHQVVRWRVEAVAGIDRVRVP